MSNSFITFIIVGICTALFSSSHHLAAASQEWVEDCVEEGNQIVCERRGGFKFAGSDFFWPPGCSNHNQLICNGLSLCQLSQYVIIRGLSSDPCVVLDDKIDPETDVPTPNDPPINPDQDNIETVPASCETSIDSETCRFCAEGQRYDSAICAGFEGLQ